MSKAFSCFFPTNLNEQGWLNDFVLPQARTPNHDLQKLLFSAGGKFDELVYGFRNDKIFSLHPRYKNKLEQRLRARLADSPADIKKAREEKEKYINFMTHIKPAQIAAMSPYILFYIVRKKHGKWDINNKKPIRFKNATDLDFITENAEHFARGDGSGIREVSVARRHPRFVLDSFEVKLSLYFSSMAAFAKKTTGKGPGQELTEKEIAAGEYYEYFKLIDPLDQKKERLILEYGWNFNDQVANELIPPDMKQIIKKQEKKQLWISWKKHDFQFTERGEIELNVEYVGGPMQDLFYKADASILPKDKFLLGGILSAQRLKEFVELQRLYDNKDKLEKKLQSWKKHKSNLGKIVRCTKPMKKDLTKKIEGKRGSPSGNIDEINKKIRHRETAMISYCADIILNTIYKNKEMFNISIWAAPVDKKLSGIWNQVKIVNSALECEKGGRLDEVYKSFTSKQQRYSPLEMLEEIKNPYWKKPADMCGTKYDVNYEVESTDKKIKTGSTEFDTNFKNFIGGVTLFNPPKVLSGKRDPADATKFNFFPLRALVQAIYKLAGPAVKDLPHVCFGNTIFRTMGQEVWVNIGDILITTETFQKWLYKIIYRDGKLNMPLGDWLREITINLANEALYHNATGGGLSNFSLGTIKWDQYMIEPTIVHNDMLWDLYYGKHFFGKPNKDHEKQALEVLLGEIKSSNEINATGAPLIFVHFVPNEDAKRSRFIGDNSLIKNMFDKENDIKLGLYHINIGDSRGLMTNIGFSYKDNEKLRTAIALQNRDTTAGYFKYTYSANVNMIGNAVFSNAGVFVIPRKTLGLSLFEDPGISGYYAIHEVRDVISPGSYTSEMQGINYYNEKVKLDNRLTDREEVEIPVFAFPKLGEYVAEVLMRSDYAKTHKLKITEEYEKQ